MNGRKRTVQIKFRVTEAERDLILEKMKLVPTRNMAAYLRKIAIDGYIIQIDHADIKAMTAEIQKIGVNVNQIARRVNATGNAYQEALANLERVNWTVDCVLTHCAPSGAVRKLNPSYGTDELTDFLEAISQRCQFAYWFFGHYHENRIIDQKYILQWEKISELSF